MISIISTLDQEDTQHFVAIVATQALCLLKMGDFLTSQMFAEQERELSTDYLDPQRLGVIIIYYREDLWASAGAAEMSLQRGSVCEGRGPLQPLPLRARSGHLLQRSDRVQNFLFSLFIYWKE